MNDKIDELEKKINKIEKDIEKNFKYFRIRYCT